MRPNPEKRSERMALTRAMLKAMGIEPEKVDQIIEAHAETVSGLKDEIAKATSEAEEGTREAGELRKKLEAIEGGEDYKSELEAKTKELEDFRAQVEADKAKAEKSRLYSQLLRECGVSERRIDAILRVTDMSGVKVEDGKLADSEKLAEAIKADWSDFIKLEGTHGANVPTPPNTDPAKPEPTNLAEAMHQKYDAND